VSELEPYDLSDPDRLIREVAGLVTLEEDTAWLALVERPSTSQELLRVVPLPIPALLDDDDDISGHLRSAVEALDVGRLAHGQGPKQMAVTIVVRPGSTEPGPNEGVWLKGWRYANHFQSIYTGDLILVTEHGWQDFMTQAAGHEPRMVTAVG